MFLISVLIMGASDFFVRYLYFSMSNIVIPTIFKKDFKHYGIGIINIDVFLNYGICFYDVSFVIMVV